MEMGFKMGQIEYHRKQGPDTFGLLLGFENIRHAIYRNGFVSCRIGQHPVSRDVPATPPLATFKPAEVEIRGYQISPCFWLSLIGQFRIRAWKNHDRIPGFIGKMKLGPEVPSPIILRQNENHIFHGPEEVNAMQSYLIYPRALNHSGSGNKPIPVIKL